MHIVPFQPKHLELMVLQPAQTAFSNYFDPAYGDALQKSGQCFTAIEDNHVYGCAGVIKQWDNRAIAWALLSAYAGRQFIRIHRAVQRFLDTTDFRRIEAFVDADFQEGHRWIQMLGFEREGYMKAFSPNGNDAVLYARIK